MSIIPLALQKHLEAALKHANKTRLKSARDHLSETYRDPQAAQTNTRHMTNDHHRLSYLATRLPATYTVCHAIFSKLASYNLPCTSFLDLGVGPGTAAICARYMFPHLSHINLIDQDEGFKGFSDSFWATSLLAPTQTTYQVQDITTVKQFTDHDIISISYALNELRDDQAHQVLQKAWQATKQALVIMEPGTPKAFSALRKRRQDLIDDGAMIVAPCPHDNACPLHTDDWCHFSARVDRSPLHKELKNAALNYEDEKYAYLIAVKDHTLLRPKNRIIKKPQKRKGHQIFDLCTSNGLQQRTITKTDKTLYKAAKKMAWGDVLDQESPTEKGEAKT